MFTISTIKHRRRLASLATPPREPQLSRSPGCFVAKSRLLWNLIIRQAEVERPNFVSALTHFPPVHKPAPTDEHHNYLTFWGLCIVSIFLLIYFQRNATLHSSIISGKLLYMFRVLFPPIIRSTYNCIYSICKYSCVCS